MNVYILCYRGTVYGVYSSKAKAMAAQRELHLDDGEILLKEVL